MLFSSDVQQDVAAQVTTILTSYAESRPGLIVGTNKAAIVLAGQVRAVDAAIWRARDVLPHSGRARRGVPLLTVEIEGDPNHASLHAEAVAWYLTNGVSTVWLVQPAEREVCVVTPDGQTKWRAPHLLPSPLNLPGLCPAVAVFFRQLDATPVATG